MNKHYVIRLTSEEREQPHEMVAKGKTARWASRASEPIRVSVVVLPARRER